MLERRACLLLLIVLLAPLATGCGGSDVVALDPVAQAAAKTEQTGSFRLAYTATVSLPAGPLEEVRVDGTGLFDTASGAGKMTFKADLPAAVERELGGSLSGEMVYETADSLVIYMRFPFLAGELPAGKKWLKVDMQALGEKQGIDFQTLMQGGQYDPTQILDVLAESYAQEIGPDRVRGVPTTSYRLDIDFADVLGGLPLGQQPGFQRMIDELGLETAPAEAWVDDEGLLRRLKMGWRLADPTSGEPISMTITQDFYDFGVTVEAKPPPPGQVVDAAELDPSLR